MTSANDSLARSVRVFEKSASLLKNSNQALFLLVSGLALLAEGLLAKHQRMENRLTAIEGALRPR